MSNILKAKKGYKLVKDLFGKEIEIPLEWNQVNLDEIVKDGKFSIVDGPFGTQLHSSEYVDKGIPVIRVFDIKKNGSFSSDDLVYITEKKFSDLIRSAIYPGDILLAKTGATIGKVCIFPKDIEKGLLASSVAKISLDLKKCDNKFGFYYLYSERGQKQILRNATGSTRLSINLTPIGKVKIILPTFKEQQKISSILSNLDNMISNNQEIIEHTIKFKKGLIQSLLTKGINHTKFKKIKWIFGKEIEIPETWKYEIVKKGCEKLSVGFVGTCDPFYTNDNGIPMLRTTNIKEGKIDLSNLKYVTKEFHEKNKKSQVKENDLLISRHGENGEACLAKGLDEANCLNIVILKPKPKEFIPEFFEIAFNSAIVRNQIRRTTAGAVQGVVNTSEIGKVKIVIPPLKEQRKISSIILNVETQIQKEIEHKSYLENLKKGLMQNLLTGKIRVKV